MSRPTLTRLGLTVQTELEDVVELCTSPLAAELLGGLVYQNAHSHKQRTGSRCSKADIANAVVRDAQYWQQAQQRAAIGTASEYRKNIDKLYAAHVQHVCDASSQPLQQGLQCMLSVLRLFPAGCDVPLAATACAWDALMQHQQQQQQHAATRMVAAWQCAEELEGNSLMELHQPHECSAFL